MSETGWKHINMFRKKYGLPTFGPAASKNQPPADIFKDRDIFSEDECSNLHATMSKRELEVLRCVLDLHMNRDGEIPPGLAVNVNESIHRKPWGVDKLDQVCTGTHTYLHCIRGLVNFTSYLRIFGWTNVNSFQLPHGFSGTVVRKLFGNSIAIPSIGSVVAMCFMAFRPEFSEWRNHFETFKNQPHSANK